MYIIKIKIRITKYFLFLEICVKNEKKKMRIYYSL